MAARRRKQTPAHRNRQRHSHISTNTARARRRTTPSAPRQRPDARHSNATARRKPTNLRRRNERRRSSAFLPVLLVLVVAAVIMGFRLIACQAPATQNQINAGIDASKLYDNPYDWSKLKTDNKGRITYVSDGKTLSYTGIDVSQHQGAIDWERVAADGIDFAYIRVGYRSADIGKIAEDETAEKNLADAGAAGLKLGVYFYSQAMSVDEAREEADLVLNAIKNTTISYPVVFDFETGNLKTERVKEMSFDDRTAVAIAFCERIEEAGYSAMVYGNASGLMGFDTEKLASRGFWYAEYASMPSTSIRMAIWQYSSTGSVAGIEGPVDLDLDLTPILKKAKK
ncbi:MAG: glycoside hydrolase family 25 protein [Coriobacteriaceae bacterium]|nr:glycoside hydrolase family 25 protein [Coriobacteriaceae bacterium]